MQITMFVAGLQQQYNKEAFSKLNRQKDPDMEALRQALIRFTTFEKNQQEMSRPALRTESTARSDSRPRQQQQMTGGTTSSGLLIKYTELYTGVICGHCQKRHRKEDCWKLYPEKRP
jgi:hypothetical protein